MPGAHWPPKYTQVKSQMVVGIGNPYMTKEGWILILFMFFFTGFIAGMFYGGLAIQMMVQQ